MACPQDYFSLPPGHGVTLVKRAVIVNTAFDGLPDYHFMAARDARNRATTINSAVQRETAAIFVPLWVDVRNDVRPLARARSRLMSTHA